MNISASQVKQAMENNDKFILLDVRTPQEFAKGKINGAINLPVDQVPEKIEHVIPDKKTAVYVYCLSGSRSLVAADNMTKLGYTAVYNMEHGLLEWRINHYPTVA